MTIRMRNARGMTYLEVLVALALFVSVAVSILISNLSMHWVSEHATTTMAAVNHLDDIMERIGTTDFGALQTTFPAGVVDGGAGQPYAVIVGGYTLDTEHIVVTYPNQTADRLEMLVTISWTFRQRARTAQLSTVRTRG